MRPLHGCRVVLATNNNTNNNTIACPEMLSCERTGGHPGETMLRCKQPGALTTSVQCNGSLSSDCAGRQLHSMTLPHVTLLD
jgi:hypothetical protein